MEKNLKIENLGRIIKNYAAMFASALLAKGGGIIVAIFVARYLNASSLGIYAVVLSVTILLEVLTPLGLQEVIIRSIARDRFLMLGQMVNASIITTLSAFGFSAILLTFIIIYPFSSEFSVTLMVAAAGLPIAGLNLVAQSVLQGAERMEYQPAAAFIGRLLGLFVTWLLLDMGSGVWSAFVGRAIFQATSLFILTIVIIRYIRQENLTKNWRPSFSSNRKSIASSIPFLLQRFLNEGLLRLHVIFLPMLMAFEAVGHFNAANQITQASSTIIPIVMLTVLPIFSRSFKSNPSEMKLLTDQTLKFLLIIIFLFAFIVTVTARKIIVILYGPGFESAAPVLQIIIWSQIFVAADSVMIQNMIASDNERAMVYRSAAGVFVNVTLTVLFGSIFGILGIAVSVVLARGILFALNVHFVRKNIYKTNLMQTAARPFLCAMLAGLFAFILTDYHLFLILPIAICLYVFLLFVFRVLTENEVAAIKDLSRHIAAKYFKGYKV